MYNTSVPYPDRIKQHLTQYKQKVLGVHKPGIFHYRGRRYEKHHILPKGQESLNILSGFRDHFYQSDFSNIPFHNYFHHLNSSQALCINLFFPLIAEGETGLICELLDLPSVNISEPAFEFESDVEQIGAGQRKTNFDLFFRLQKSLKVYVELKFTEQGFGTAKKDSEHLEKFNHTYAPMLEQNPFIRNEFKHVDAFLSHYQIMRNLVHISDESVVVFILPMSNLPLLPQLQTAYHNMLTHEGRSKLRLLPLETIIPHIIKHAQSPKLKEHFCEFQRKYAIENINPNQSKSFWQQVMA